VTFAGIDLAKKAVERRALGGTRVPEMDIVLSGDPARGTGRLAVRDRAAAAVRRRSATAIKKEIARLEKLSAKADDDDAARDLREEIKVLQERLEDFVD
jgi:hypothetical protein